MVIARDWPGNGESHTITHYGVWYVYKSHHLSIETQLLDPLSVLYTQVLP